MEWGFDEQAAIFFLSPGFHIASLDAPIGKEDGSMTTLHDTLAQEEAEEPLFDVEKLMQSVEKLPPRPRDIVQQRLSGRTLDEIGKTHGISRERVRQIEGKALEFLTRRIGRSLHLQGTLASIASTTAHG
jgi:RNA polymerase sigma factor (sigma-70 family)